MVVSFKYYSLVCNISSDMKKKVDKPREVDLALRFGANMECCFLENEGVFRTEQWVAEGICNATPFRMAADVDNTDTLTVLV